MKTSRLFFALGLIAAGILRAQSKPVAAPDITGVYQLLPDKATTPDGHRNEGSPDQLPLLPAALAQSKTVDLKQDPAKWCQPIGPFRMMAREKNKIEIMPIPGSITILFEDVSRGLLRTIRLDRDHVKLPDATWQGDSIGHWDNGVLVIDTNDFNDRTFLNDKGAPHSEQLRLIERIRPLLNGKYLEYKATAEDPKVLAKPYTYTRYYEKVDSEIVEDFCDNEE